MNQRVGSPILGRVILVALIFAVLNHRPPVVAPSAAV
jgi:hypothetical protein